MRRLSIDHPEIHVMFMSGHLVVQKINKNVNAVSQIYSGNKAFRDLNIASMLLLARKEKKNT